jgi:hypothetical protein
LYCFTVHEREREVYQQLGLPLTRRNETSCWLLSSPPLFCARPGAGRALSSPSLRPTCLRSTTATSQLHLSNQSNPVFQQKRKSLRFALATVRPAYGYATGTRMVLSPNGKQPPRRVKEAEPCNGAREAPPPPASKPEPCRHDRSRGLSW